MSPGIRRIVALVIASAVAFGVIYFIDHLAASSAGVPAGSPSDLKSAMEAGRIPFNGLLLVLGGWLVASYIGSTMASRLSGERGPALLFAALITFVTLTTLFSAAHPTWMWLGGLIGVPLIALGAAGESITVRSR